MKPVLRIAALVMSLTLMVGARHNLRAATQQDCLTNCAIGYAQCNMVNSEAYCNGFWYGCIYACGYRG